MNAGSVPEASAAFTRSSRVRIGARVAVSGGSGVIVVKKTSCWLWSDTAERKSGCAPVRSWSATSAVMTSCRRNCLSGAESKRLSLWSRFCGGRACSRSAVLVAL